jgi:hypothetical protein
MSTVTGSITVGVEFRDATTSSGVQSLNAIALRDTTEYTTGKVLVVTGVAGTSAVSLAQLNGVYRNAAGNFVSIATPLRIAFSWSGSNYRELLNASDFAFKIRSRNGSVAVTEIEGQAAGVFAYLESGIGTGTYTIVLYGT